MQSGADVIISENILLLKIMIFRACYIYHLLPQLF